MFINKHNIVFKSGVYYNLQINKTIKNKNGCCFM